MWGRAHSIILNIVARDRRPTPVAVLHEPEGPRAPVPQIALDRAPTFFLAGMRVQLFSALEYKVSKDRAIDFGARDHKFFFTMGTMEYNKFFAHFILEIAAKSSSQSWLGVIFSR